MEIIRNALVRNAALALFFLAAPIAAQSPAIIGRDNAAFARELYVRGWPDLAEGVIRVFTELDQQGKADHFELLAVQAVGLDLELDLARRDPDVDKRRQGIAKVITAKEKLIADSPRTEIARETRDNLPDAYRLLGEAISAALETESDPAVQAKLREEGQAAFVRLEHDLQQRLDTLREQHLEEVRTAEDLQYMNALFNIGRTRYFHARIHPKDSPSHGALLNGAIKAFAEVSRDYQDLLINFEATFYAGLCRKAQGKHEKALKDWLFNITTLREGVPTDASGRFELTDVVADIVSRSALQRVLLHTETGKFAEAIAVADDYLDKTVEPARGSGLALLNAKADAQLAAGDTTAAGDTAKRLLELDPQGPWGNKARELQLKLLGGGGSSIGAGEILRAAQNMFAQGKLDQALQVGRQVLVAAKGDAKEQDYGSQGLLLMGQVYRKLELYHEASLVFDTAFERFPKGAATPDALSNAMDCYRKLNAKERRPYYKTRVDERGQTLVREFPTHPAVATIQQGEARELRDDGKFLEAAQLFRSVPSTSSGYAEAQVQAGTCLYAQGRALAKEGKPDQAKTMFVEAEAQLVKSLGDIASAKQKSLDQQVLFALGKSEFTAMTMLARVYLEDLVGKPDKVLTTLEGADERYASNADAIGELWQLRIRAEEKLGKVDEAVLKFEELYKKESDRAKLAAPAGVLARSLDGRATEAWKSPDKRDAALRDWRKALELYLISIRPQLDNRSIANPAELEPVGKRLLELGMSFNGMPDEMNSFVGWQSGTTVDKSAWEPAANIYDVVVELDPANYRARIRQARVLGFLSRWKDAAAAYAALFDQELLIKSGKTFDRAVVDAKPELLEAYLEWGVCEAEVGLMEKSGTRQDRASEIFDSLLTQLPRETAVWWSAKYLQISTFFKRGQYPSAKVAMNSLERATAAEFANAPAHLRPLLISLRAELKKR